MGSFVERGNTAKRGKGEKTMDLDTVAHSQSKVKKKKGDYRKVFANPSVIPEGNLILLLGPKGGGAKALANVWLNN